MTVVDYGQISIVYLVLAHSLPLVLSFFIPAIMVSVVPVIPYAHRASGGAFPEFFADLSPAYFAGAETEPFTGVKSAKTTVAGRMEPALSSLGASVSPNVREVGSIATAPGARPGCLTPFPLPCCTE